MSAVGEDWRQALELVGIAWHLDAACARPDAAGVSFFPDLGESAAPAKAVCAGCPVVEDCLAYAQRYQIKDGIWGGLSPKERRKPS